MPQPLCWRRAQHRARDHALRPARAPGAHTRLAQKRHPRHLRHQVTDPPQPPQPQKPQKPQKPPFPPMQHIWDTPQRFAPRNRMLINPRSCNPRTACGVGIMPAEPRLYSSNLHTAQRDAQHRPAHPHVYTCMTRPIEIQRRRAERAAAEHLMPMPSLSRTSCADRPGAYAPCSEARSAGLCLAEPRTRPGLP